MKTAILYIPGNLNHMEDAYFNASSPLYGQKDKVIKANVYQEPNKKKTSIKVIREYVKNTLTDALVQAKVKVLLIGDADYFKVITGMKSAEPYLGYKCTSLCENFDCFYIPSYRRIFIDPENTKENIEYVFSQYKDFLNGKYIEPGSNLIKHKWFPETVEEIKEALNLLLQKNQDLTVDIETYNLRHTKARLGSIAFSWDTEGGIAFTIDHIEGDPDPKPNKEVRELLKQFFILFNKKITFHRITYDNYVLIYQLFMKSSIDTEGLLQGIDILFKNWDCTHLMAYLSLNSCTRPDLSLKSLAQEFAGNWAVDSEKIENIHLLPREELLTYNLIDTMSTKYVKDKYEPVLDAEEQRDIYENIFKPAAVDIVQMQLTGLPVDMDEVVKARKKLEDILKPCKHVFDNSPIISAFVIKIRKEFMDAKNSTLKVKQLTMEDDQVQRIKFNPNSSPQLQKLLYDYMGLPVIDYTKTGAPATGGEDIKTLKAYIDPNDKDGIELLDSLITHKSVIKILNSFIPALENAHKAEDGWHYLHGFFNLGGTVSGRLSSNNPNLQNIPSKGKLAEIIKQCFKAPPGWLFVGLDYASLEDRISALTTKDKNKLKVYTDGYEGHCLRAYSYYSELMPDIDPNSVESINSIKTKYPELRNSSKTPTFLLTYRGTYMGLAKKCNMSVDQAKEIEKRYQDLYKESIEWVDNKLNQASIDGYVTGAFGLRIRTPLLSQVVLGTNSTPYEAQQEARTAGNGLGQSWCLLNSRSSSEFMGKVRKDKEFYRYNIRPCAQIHDAFYMIVKNDVSIVSYVNKHLVKAVNWNDHPEIYHPEVGLGGELSIFYPTWNDEIVIPNHVYGEDLVKFINK